MKEATKQELLKEFVQMTLGPNLNVLSVEDEKHTKGLYGIEPLILVPYTAENEDKQLKESSLTFHLIDFCTFLYNRDKGPTVKFTGLIDKNGKGIYCKDEFRINGGPVFEVQFKKGAFGYSVHDNSEPGGDGRFVSFAENFANCKGKGNQLNAVEVVKN